MKRINAVLCVLIISSTALSSENITQFKRENPMTYALTVNAINVAKCTLALALSIPKLIGGGVEQTGAAVVDLVESGLKRQVSLQTSACTSEANLNDLKILVTMGCIERICQPFDASIPAFEKSYSIDCTNSLIEAH